VTLAPGEAVTSVVTVDTPRAFEPFMGSRDVTVPVWVNPETLLTVIATCFP
jgi:hypothetical protein